jgi:hypothetical protein
MLSNMMTTVTNVTTTTMTGGTTVSGGTTINGGTVVGGRSLSLEYLNSAEFRPIGKEREKRSSDRMNGHSTPSGSIPTHPISQSLPHILQKLINEMMANIKSQTSPVFGPSWNHSIGLLKGKHKRKRSSSACVQLLACKLGRSISSSLGRPAGVLLDVIRWVLLWRRI